MIFPSFPNQVLHRDQPWPCPARWWCGSFVKIFHLPWLLWPVCRCCLSPILLAGFACHLSVGSKFVPGLDDTFSLVVCLLNECRNRVGLLLSPRRSKRFVLSSIPIVSFSPMHVTRTSLFAYFPYLCLAPPSSSADPLPFPRAIRLHACDLLLFFFAILLCCCYVGKKSRRLA